MTLREKTYNIWYAMKQRCENPAHDSYCRYGAKGITVSIEWQVFDTFLRDMGHRPEKATLDRLDNSKGYSKENCRWTDTVTQALNKGMRTDNSSGHKGVYWHKTAQKWFARGSKGGKLFELYYGDSYEEACAARVAWEKLHVST